MQRMREKNNHRRKLMIVRIKAVHPDAHVPKYAKPGDAGMDLHATDFATDDHGNYVYHTG